MKTCKKHFRQLDGNGNCLECNGKPNEMKTKIPDKVKRSMDDVERAYQLGRQQTAKDVIELINEVIDDIEKAGYDNPQDAGYHNAMENIRYLMT